MLIIKLSESSMAACKNSMRASHFLIVLLFVLSIAFLAPKKTASQNCDGGTTLWTCDQKCTRDCNRRCSNGVCNCPNNYWSCSNKCNGECRNRANPRNGQCINRGLACRCCDPPRITETESSLVASV